MTNRWCWSRRHLLARALGSVECAVPHRDRGRITCFSQSRHLSDHIQLLEHLLPSLVSSQSPISTWSLPETVNVAGSAVAIPSILRQCFSYCLLSLNSSISPLPEKQVNVTSDRFYLCGFLWACTWLQLPNSKTTLPDAFFQKMGCHTRDPAMVFPTAVSSCSKHIWISCWVEEEHGCERFWFYSLTCYTRFRLAFRFSIGQTVTELPVHPESTIHLDCVFQSFIWPICLNVMAFVTLHSFPHFDMGWWRSIAAVRGNVWRRNSWSLQVSLISSCHFAWSAHCSCCCMQPFWERHLNHNVGAVRPSISLTTRNSR